MGGHFAFNTFANCRCETQDNESNVVDSACHGHHPIGEVVNETPADDHAGERPSGRDEGRKGANDGTRHGSHSDPRARHDDRAARPARDGGTGGKHSSPRDGQPRGEDNKNGGPARGRSGRDGQSGGGQSRGYGRDGQSGSGQSRGYGRDGHAGGQSGARSGGGLSRGYGRDTAAGSGDRDGRRSGGTRSGEQERRSYGAGGPARDGERRGGSGDRGGSRDGGYRSGGQRDGSSRSGGQRDGAKREWSRDGKPPARQGGGHPGAGGKRDDNRRDEKLWVRGGKPARGDRDARDTEYELTEEERLARELRPVRARHDDPELPEDVQPRDLDKAARVELKSLSKENADWVAQHLVMAARLIEEDPARAHEHAMSAARRAGRVGVVRETLAITAYATGDFALALRELRTYRRISGSNDQLPLMVDSERGVGRADRALELGRSVDRATLPNDVQVSLAIAMSGARLDLGQNEAALAELEIPQLDPNRAFSWSPDLFHAYADVLEELGRTDQAETWRERAGRAEDAIGVALSVDEHETIDIVEEEYEFDLEGEDSVSIADAGDETEEHTQSDEDGGDDGTVPAES